MYGAAPGSQPLSTHYLQHLEPLLLQGDVVRKVDSEVYHWFLESYANRLKQEARKSVSP